MTPLDYAAYAWAGIVILAMAGLTVSNCLTQLI